MRQNEHGQYVSDDGFWVWDGTQWVPAAQPQPSAEEQPSVEGQQSAQAQPSAGSTDDAPTTAGQATSAGSTGDAHASYGAEAAQPAAAYESGARESTAYESAAYESGAYESAARESTAYGSEAAQPAATQPAAAAQPGLAVESAVTGGRATIEPHVDRAHPLSPDGRHWWTGDEWVEVDTAALAAGDRTADETPAQPQSSSAPAASLDLVSGGGTAVDRPPADAADTVTGFDRPVAGATSAQHAGWQAETASPEPAQQVAPAGQNVIPQGQRQRSPDGYWEWDGSQWVAANAERSASGRQLSPDGLWEWDGSQWVPAGGAVAEVPEGAHVSPDGHWWWNGTQWVPTGR